MPIDSDHSSVLRKHVTIMFTDIAGYTALMGSDEDKAFEILHKNRNIHNQFLKEYNGKLIKEIGDGMLLSFNLPSDAVRCAIKIQETCKREQIPLKIGIHDGEVTFEGSDVFGDGVNISSRLQADARKGNIYVSDSVYRNVKNKSDIKSRYVDEKAYKNVDERIKVYQILTGEEEHLVEHPGVKKVGKSRKIKIINIFLGMLIFSLSGILIWKFLPIFDKSEVERSIAVMPFSNETPDASNIYLANGMMEEIRNNLAKIGDLRVLSKTSTDKYRNTQLSLMEIANQLNVNYLVEGSIQKQGEIVKIHAQLIDIGNDDHMWAETFTSDINNMFSIQSEIAQMIAGQLKAIITPKEKEILERKPTNNSEAYDLYLRGKELFHRGGISNINMAINFYERAIKLDPDFALVYAWLGMAYFRKSGMKDYMKENFADTLLYYANLALKLDPDLSDGYWLRAEYHLQKSQLDSSLMDAKRALHLNPNNGEAYMTAGWNYYYLKDFTNVFIYLAKARNILRGDLNQYPIILDRIATVYMAIGDYEKTHKYCEEIVNYQPDYGYFLLWFLNLAKKEFDKSKVYLNSLCALDSMGWRCKMGTMYYYIFSGQFDNFKPEQDHLDLFSIAEPYWKAYILSKLHNEERAKEYFEQAFNELERTIELERLSATGGMDPYDLAAQYCYIGETDNAYQILHYMEEQKNLECWMIWWMDYDPRFEAMRQEEEFKEIIERQLERYADIRAEIDDLEKAGMF